MQDCENVDEFESMDPYGTKEIMANAHTTYGIFRIDGLPCSLPKRKYTMTQHVRKEKKPRRIRFSRVERISLANVQQDLQPSICSKDCLKKLDAEAVLMKWFRAWRYSEYEERAS